MAEWLEQCLSVMKCTFMMSSVGSSLRHSKKFRLYVTFIDPCHLTSRGQIDNRCFVLSVRYKQRPDGVKSVGQRNRDDNGRR